MNKLLLCMLILSLCGTMGCSSQPIARFAEALADSDQKAGSHPYWDDKGALTWYTDATWDEAKKSRKWILVVIERKT